MQKPFFQVPAGPFRSLYPLSRHQASSSLTLPYVELFLCSTWSPQGTRATGTPEAGELLLMQGTESPGQQHEGSAWGEEMDLQEGRPGPVRPWSRCPLRSRKGGREMGHCPSTNYRPPPSITFSLSFRKRKKNESISRRSSVLI